MSLTCICGYTSAKPNTVRRHQKVCKTHLVHEALKTSESGNTQQEKHIAALEASDGTGKPKGTRDRRHEGRPKT
jgi:hypothetical protein